MTPQEKAKELVNMFLRHSQEGLNYYHSKQCALFCVTEIQEALQKDSPKEMWNGKDFVSDEYYFKTVKAEIEKL